MKNIAIIGAGFIAKVHAAAILAAGNTVYSAVSNIESQAREFAAACNAVEWRTDYRDIDIDRIDCVHICTEPSLHYEMIKFFVEKKVPVICEKPLTLKKEEAESLSRLIDESGAKVCVCFNNRFYPAVQEMKQLIESKRFKEPLMLYGIYEQSFHIPPVMNSWRFDADGGNDLRAVSEIGSHLIDLMQFVTGESISRVSAKFKNRTDSLYLDERGNLTENETGSKFELKNEDIAIVTLEFESGIIASLCLSEVSAGKVNELNLTVICKDGRVSWTNERTDRLEIADRSGSFLQSFGMQTGFSDSYVNIFRDFYGFADGASGGKFATVSDAAGNVAVCRAILESAGNDGRFVSVCERG